MWYTPWEVLLIVAGSTVVMLVAKFVLEFLFDKIQKGLTK